MNIASGCMSNEEGVLRKQGCECVNERTGSCISKMPLQIKRSLNNQQFLLENVPETLSFWDDGRMITLIPPSTTCELRMEANHIAKGKLKN